MPSKFGKRFQPRAFPPQYVLEAAGDATVHGSRRSVDWRKLTVWLAVIAGPWTVLVLLVGALL